MPVRDIAARWAGRAMADPADASRGTSRRRWQQLRASPSGLRGWQDWTCLTVGVGTRPMRPLPCSTPWTCSPRSPHNGSARTRRPESPNRGRRASPFRRGAAVGARTFGCAGERFPDARRGSGREAPFPVRGGGTRVGRTGVAGMVPFPQQWEERSTSSSGSSSRLKYCSTPRPGHQMYLRRPSVRYCMPPPVVGTMAHSP